MFGSLDEIQKYFEDETHAIEEKINKNVDSHLTGKYFALTRNRHYGKKIKYYGKITHALIYQGGDRYGIWTTISLNYINKKGEPKSISLRLDGYNDIRLFDDEASAKLFLEVSD